MPKICKQIGCNIEISDKHVYCYDHYCEFQKWLAESSRKAKSLIDGYNMPDHGEEYKREHGHSDHFFNQGPYGMPPEGESENDR